MHLSNTQNKVSYLTFHAKGISCNYASKYDFFAVIKESFDVPYMTIANSRYPKWFKSSKFYCCSKPGSIKQQKTMKILTKNWILHFECNCIFLDVVSKGKSCFYISYYCIIMTFFAKTTNDLCMLLSALQKNY